MCREQCVQVTEPVSGRARFQTLSQAPAATLVTLTHTASHCLGGVSLQCGVRVSVCAQ